MASNQDDVNIFWFRRDLRLEDNAALYHALKANIPVIPIFIFDTHILHQLEDKSDKRVNFIHHQLIQLNLQLVKLGTTLKVYYGEPLRVWKQLFDDYNIHSVFTNHDYEPYARQRDETIKQFLQEKNITFHTYKDQVIFEKNDIIKSDGTPYTVFTPYSKKWKSQLVISDYNCYDIEKYSHNFSKMDMQHVMPLSDIGFYPILLQIPSSQIDSSKISKYHEQRDYPAMQGTSQLGLHLRFGTISIRQLVEKALQLNDVFLNELIWREFYQMILWHFPQVVRQSFKPQYDQIAWLNNETEFQRWCQGQTGYPIVDAGMRQLNATGYMHNRVRMITASFLTKHLLIDWRWGEAYFAKKLLDFDLASNNGGWQWVAGTGCDAAPYFRVFNPALQTAKFDQNLTYIKEWVPEYATLTYLQQTIVEHNFARKRCIEAYKRAL